MSNNEKLPPGKVLALIIDQISQLALILTHLVRIPKKIVLSGADVGDECQGFC